MAYETVVHPDCRTWVVHLFKGHLDENELREELEHELGDKEQVEWLLERRQIMHTYGKMLPNKWWWTTDNPKPKQKTTPITILG